MHSSRAFFAGLLGFGSLLVLGFTLAGWGFWGFGVYGDYSLDLADGLRLHQGDRPFKDFFPTYGVLIHFLMAPWFNAGSYFFPILWTLTVVSVFLAMVAWVQSVRSELLPFWQVILILIGISTVIFSSSNAKWIMGYSHAGLLGGLIWTIVFWILSCNSHSQKWLFVGMAFGLQIFTKIDLAATALVASAGFLILLLIQKEYRSMQKLFVGLAGTWGIVIIGLILYGAPIERLIETTLECFGQATMFGDPVFKKRCFIIFSAGILFGLSLALPFSRPWMLTMKGRLGNLLIWLFPAALSFDFFRGLEMDSLKKGTILNFYWMILWSVTSGVLMSAFIRKKSFRVFLFPKWERFTLLYLVSGMGLIRVAITGWYPMNYYQPAIFLLGLLWLSRQSRPMNSSLKNKFGIIVLLLMAGNLGISWRDNANASYSLAEQETPFGTIKLKMDPTTLQDQQHLLSLLKSSANKSDSILCTYEPSIQVLSGLRSAATYTYFSHVGWSGIYLKEREQHAFEVFKQRNPRFVLYEWERASFATYFGKDFGKDLAAYIDENYQVIHQSPAGSQFQRKLYERKN